jgi:disulfide bond formation protein DsbB
MREDYARFLNAIALLGINALLAFAFTDQFLFSDLPCPLCLLQRVGFVLAGFGFALNVLYAPRPSHYGLVIVSALAGAAVAGRQVLLHILPGSGAYGDPLFGLHFYTWAFIAFASTIAGSAFLMMFEGQPQTNSQISVTDGSAHRTSSTVLKQVGLFAVLLFGALVAANGIVTFLQCSTGLCPDDPIRYELFKLEERSDTEFTSVWGPIRPFGEVKSHKSAVGTGFRNRAS